MVASEAFAKSLLTNRKCCGIVWGQKCSVCLAELLSAIGDIFSFAISMFVYSKRTLLRLTRLRQTFFASFLLVDYRACIYILLHRWGKCEERLSTPKKCVVSFLEYFYVWGSSTNPFTYIFFSLPSLHSMLCEFIQKPPKNVSFSRLFCAFCVSIHASCVMIGWRAVAERETGTETELVQYLMCRSKRYDGAEL